MGRRRQSGHGAVGWVWDWQALGEVGTVWAWGCKGSSRAEGWVGAATCPHWEGTHGLGGHPQRASMQWAPLGASTNLVSAGPPILSGSSVTLAGGHKGGHHQGG